MPLFDQHGLEKQNGRVKEVAASLAKGAILALGKRESLTLTLTDMPEEIIDTIVGHLVADRVGCITGSTQPFARTLLLLGDDGRMEYRMLILDVRPRMYHSQSETHANFLHMDNMSALPAIPIMNLRASMQNLMPTLLAHTREAPMGDRYLRGYSSARFYAGAEQHASGVRFFGLPEQEASLPRSTLRLLPEEGTDDLLVCINELKIALNDLERAAQTSLIRTARQPFEGLESVENPRGASTIGYGDVDVDSGDVDSGDNSDAYHAHNNASSSDSDA